MLSILKIKFTLFFRKPWAFIILTAITLFFAFLLGQNIGPKLIIPVVSENENFEDSDVWETLSTSDVFTFEIIEQEELKTLVSEGDAIAGVELSEQTFKITITSNSENVNILNNYLQSVYSDLYLNEKIVEIAQTEENIDIIALEEQLEGSKDQPLFEMTTENFRGDDTFIYDNSLQAIYGFSLFFVIYTIAYNVLSILTEKKQGVWDRMILSPVRKIQMYTANLFYSFILGYIQVLLIFSVFHFLAGIDFYGAFNKILIILIPYVFSIVALSLFLCSIVRTVQQFNASISFVAVSLAMIGGAYWPIEIVESDFLLLLAKFNPVTYGMEALKEATIYNASLIDLMQPMMILMLMGVTLMGIGINLMERRAR